MKTKPPIASLTKFWCSDSNDTSLEATIKNFIKNVSCIHKKELATPTPSQPKHISYLVKPFIMFKASCLCCSVGLSG